MAGTMLVLVVVLIGRLLAPLAVLVATSWLAKREGRSLKSMSWSLRGYTVEFFEREEPQNGNN